MANFRFCPGIASDRLNELAQGKSKNSVLQELVQNYVIFACDLHSDYSRLTEIGHELVVLSKQSRMPWDVLIAQSKSARIIGASLKKSFQNIPRKTDLIEGLHKQDGSSITFRPYDQEDKLNQLADYSGLPKSAVLRLLIIGLPLPNRMAMKTYGRLGQIGGLAKHIAAMNHSGEWHALFAEGIAICRLAGDLAEGQHTVQQNAEAVGEC